MKDLAQGAMLEPGNTKKKIYISGVLQLVTTFRFSIAKKYFWTVAH